DYVKLDDQPATLAALPESFLRAWRIACTEPQGPVYLCLDAALQEQPLEHAIALPDASRFRPAVAPHADPQTIDAVARRLTEARQPLIVAESPRRRPRGPAAAVRLPQMLD